MLIIAAQILASVVLSVILVRLLLELEARRRRRRLVARIMAAEARLVGPVEGSIRKGELVALHIDSVGRQRFKAAMHHERSDGGDAA